MSIQEPYTNDHTRPQSLVDLHHAQHLKIQVACFTETQTVTLEGIAPAAQAVVLQGELAVVEGLAETDPVLATSALPTT